MQMEETMRHEVETGFTALDWASGGVEKNMEAAAGRGLAVLA